MGRVARRSLGEKLTIENRLEGRGIQAKGVASAKALRWQSAWEAQQRGRCCCGGVNEGKGRREQGEGSGGTDP